MMGAMRSEWQAASIALKRRWDGLRFSGMGRKWATVVKEAVCPQFHRKTFRGEIHPLCDQKQVVPYNSILNSHCFGILHSAVHCSVTANLRTHVELIASLGVTFPMSYCS